MSKPTKLSAGDIYSILATQLGKPVSEVKEVVQAFTGLVGDKVADGQPVTVDSLGVLTPVHKPERMGRNPSTGEALLIKAKTVPKFKSSKALQDKM